MTTLPDIASAPLPARFEPKTTKEKVSVFTAAIEHAQRVRDWVGLANAVEAKIEEQAEFVEWWKGHIRPEGRSGKTVSDPKLLSVYQAEEATGITKLQVHKWSKRLADRDAYRQKLYGAAWRAAMIVSAAQVSHNTGCNRYLGSHRSAGFRGA